MVNISSKKSSILKGSYQTSLTPAPRDSHGVIVTPSQQKIFRSTFSKTLSSIDSDYFTTISSGSGQTVSQSSGNLVITTGTTVNSETIVRSKSEFTGNIISKVQTILSQRIANQSFFVELVDVIGDNLAASASSSTSLTVTIPNNPFTSQNIGQSMYIGALSGGLLGLPARYPIASVSGDNVTFTVAGFLISSGSCSLFGWNYFQSLYNGTIATTCNYDSQRKGWNSGFSALTIATTAAPGHLLIMGNEDGNAFLADSLVGSSASLSCTQRGSRLINLPEETSQLFLQIRCLNGSVSPASSTTWTLGTVSIENYATTPVSLYNSKPQGSANSPPVSLAGGTVTTVGTLNALANGQSAHSAAATGSPVRVGGKVATTLDTSLVNGDASDLFLTSAGQQVQKPYGSSENDWQYAAAAGGIVNTTTAVTIKAAGAVSIRNYITGIIIMADALGAATELVIRDGANGTVLFRIRIPATGLVTNQINFPTPLRGTAATLLEVATLTASVTGSVYFNAQGYQSI